MVNPLRPPKDAARVLGVSVKTPDGPPIIIDKPVASMIWLPPRVIGAGALYSGGMGLSLVCRGMKQGENGNVSWGCIAILLAAFYCLSLTVQVAS